jgi:transcriptional regulator with XRE-family HTH domain
VVWVRRLARNGGARAIREGAGISASEVARLIGVTPGAVSRWERGTRVPRGKIAEEWAALLRRLSGLPAANGAHEMREAGFPASEPPADGDVDGQPSAA